ncbi:MAG TPA: hypothetical protein PLB25_03430 [Rhodoferax sp.]|nr:hypothetical protein [Rhodoferax sp.]
MDPAEGRVWIETLMAAYRLIRSLPVSPASKGGRKLKRIGQPQRDPENQIKSGSRPRPDCAGSYFIDSKDNQH